VRVEGKVIHEFEIVKASGLCDIFDRYCVLQAAERMRLHNLTKFILYRGRAGYVELLKNYHKRRRSAVGWKKG
jgi:hypothetical protein